MKINKRTVDALSVANKDYTEWDEDLTGFGIRVWPSGKKVYLVRYRHGGRQRFFKIGEHGPVTPDLARREAQIKLGDVARGEDPQEESKRGVEAVQGL
ncbi:MAG: Arm DNA-binding domain-containing protein [Paracoccus sp. (in: a-proteobacteria)]|uniref:Arm DNA-binding domain-containing protein n=1 Tax=Paracoccus sp. TaxID=267 RepID=UPI0039E246F0